MRQLDLIPRKPDPPAPEAPAPVAPPLPDALDLRDPAALDDALPATQQLAEVLERRSGRVVRLPPKFAKRAVEEWFKTYKAVGDVIEGPCSGELTGKPLNQLEWALRIENCQWDLKLQPMAMYRVDRSLVYVFPRHTIFVAAPQVGWLLRALERVKPEEVDALGRPLSWVPPKHATRSLGGDKEDDDAVRVRAGEALPPVVEEPSSATPSQVTDAEIREWFEKLCRTAGFATVPLTLTRGASHRHGLTTGRVWYGDDHLPRRVHVTTCPNSDLAEVLATLAHELAHPLSRTHDHGAAFKRAFVEFASKTWGEGYFAEARAHLGDGYEVLDCWAATGIRAALRAGPPPSAKTGDDGQLARVVTRIGKLRELAANQLGLPEAIAATAAANDLITTYGLGNYSVRVDAGIHEQMVDRWVPIEEGSVWRRMLAHGVAKASDVFALALARDSRMHFFGRHADVVQAEYLYTITSERIERECERHLAAWRVKRDLTPGATVRERTSFCDSAVNAFCLKLQVIVKEESASVSGRRAPRSSALEAAEEFARVEHDRRGLGWRSGGTRRSRDNAAGREVGSALEVVRGLSSSGEAPKALPKKR